MFKAIIRKIEIAAAKKTAVGVVTKWGPTATTIAIAIARFLSPSVKQYVDSHPHSFVALLALAIVNAFYPHPVKGNS